MDKFLYSRAFSITCAYIHDWRFTEALGSWANGG